MNSTIQSRLRRQPKSGEHARSASCVPAAKGTNADYLIEVWQDGELFHYWLRRLTSDFGVAFRFEQGTAGNVRSEMQAEAYDVCVEAEHGHCGCPGHLRWGCECKHLWALRDLLARGEIPAVPHGDGCPCDGCRRLAGHSPAGHDHGLPF